MNWREARRGDGEAERSAVCGAASGRRRATTRPPRRPFRRPARKYGAAPRCGGRGGVAGCGERIGGEARGMRQCDEFGLLRGALPRRATCATPHWLLPAPWGGGAGVAPGSSPAPLCPRAGARAALGCPRGARASSAPRGKSLVSVAGFGLAWWSHGWRASELQAGRRLRPRRRRWRSHGAVFSSADRPPLPTAPLHPSTPPGGCPCLFTRFGRRIGESSQVQAARHDRVPLGRPHGPRQRSRAPPPHGVLPFREDGGHRLCRGRPEGGVRGHQRVLPPARLDVRRRRPQILRGESCIGAWARLGARAAAGRRGGLLAARARRLPRAGQPDEPPNIRPRPPRVSASSVSSRSATGLELGTST